MTEGTDDRGDSTASSDLQRAHPLQNTWCFWVHLHSNSKDWQPQKNVHSFSSVEEFWQLFNSIKMPSKLGITDSSVFKKGIAPEWEDETCRAGGRWLAKIDRMKPNDFDNLWQDLVLTMIGESLGDEGSCICGAVVTSRNKSNKVALWLSVRDEETTMRIGRAYHKVLQEAGFNGDVHFEDFVSQAKAAFSLQGIGRGRPEQA